MNPSNNLWVGKRMLIHIKFHGCNLLFFTDSNMQASYIRSCIILIFLPLRLLQMSIIQAATASQSVSVNQSYWGILQISLYWYIMIYELKASDGAICHCNS